jgi:uncharacterized protein
VVLVAPEEEPVVAQVLNAAAWTDVAATLTGGLTLPFDRFAFGPLGGTRRTDRAG